MCTLLTPFQWAPGVSAGVWIAIFLVLVLALNIIAVSFFGEAEFWYVPFIPMAEWYTSKRALGVLQNYRCPGGFRDSADVSALPFLGLRVSS